MDERVEVPAVVDFGLDGVAPAHDELGQEDADEDEVVEQEVFVDGLVEFFDKRCVFSEQVLDTGEVVDGVEDDEGQVDDKQA